MVCVYSERLQRSPFHLQLGSVFLWQVLVLSEQHAGLPSSFQHQSAANSKISDAICDKTDQKVSISGTHRQEHNP